MLTKFFLQEGKIKTCPKEQVEGLFFSCTSTFQILDKFIVRTT